MWPVGRGRVAEVGAPREGGGIRAPFLARKLHADTERTFLWRYCGLFIVGHILSAYRMAASVMTHVRRWDDMLQGPSLHIFAYCICFGDLFSGLAISQHLACNSGGWNPC